MPDRTQIPFVLGAVLAFWMGVANTSAKEPAVDFNRDIRSLLFSRCVTCHGPDEEERAAGLRLDTAEGATEDLGGYAAIAPGDADASEMIARILSEDDELRMPPPGKGTPLEPDEIKRLRDWIDQGAPYATHWAYQVPEQPSLPEVKHATWPSNAIDYFTLAKMEANGQSPSPPAGRLAIARRLALDLTGLPPTWKEAESFANDPRENAYEIYVDSLLGKPTFGERWARVWLDLARYADSAGYADDPPRTIWPYRDYVIRAINANMPFDQFTIEQIAGDLLPNPTEDQLIATAFHRNTLTNNEGGTNDEEFRNVAIVDRVNTTMAVWMGTTMACAQCHTHKYDPITQEEYFRFFAFFNSTEDSDKRDERPVLQLYSDAQKRRRSDIQSRMIELESIIETPSQTVDTERDEWLENLQKPPTWTHVTEAASGERRNFIVDAHGWQESRPTDSQQNGKDPSTPSKQKSESTQELPSKETLTLEIKTHDQPISGIRLETSSRQQSNFVLSQIRAQWKPEGTPSVSGRFVRVTLPGKKKNLHLAELEVFSGGKNIAVEAKASQVSTYADAIAKRVNDGNTNGDYKSGSVAHTAQTDDPWIELDLGNEQSIDKIVVWNRTDGGENIVRRLDGFELSVLDSNRQRVWHESPSKRGKRRYELSPSGTQEVEFAVAVADFQQSGFPSSSVLTDKIDPARGWAVAPKTGQPHHLILATNKPLPATPGVLKVTIEQRSKYEQHLLTRFRILLTSDPQVAQWAQLDGPVRSIVAKSSEEWSQREQATVQNFFRKIAPSLAPANAELSKLRRELTEMKPYSSVPILKELARDSRRETNVQIRGNYQSTGQKVSEGTPATFHPIDNQDAPNRLDLAHWLVDQRNPLTARVIVNRHWEQLFGIGIVSTSEEFGSQGDLPSHPELLDYLAVEFRESGWDIKQLIKRMVMSSTYRQSSVSTPDAIKADPDNRLLARGPRFRISAEMVRDQALFVSGLLSAKQFGPPVKPPQPELGLKAAFGSATDWKTSVGEDRYRRGIYTTWRRSSPYPSMAQFDAPNREVCTVRRIRTNTPLQALVTLNDPVYVEAAQSLARKMIQHSDDPKERLRFAFQSCLIRQPSDFEVNRLTDLASHLQAEYESDAMSAIKMATNPLGPLTEEQDVYEHAAWTVVANVILNLDEVFLKR